MYMFYIWLAILIIGLIVELIVEGSLVSVWFSVGALVPLFMSLTKNNSTNFIITEIIIKLYARRNNGLFFTFLISLKV